MRAVLRALMALLTVMLVTAVVTLAGPTPAQAAGADPVGTWPLQPKPAVVRPFVAPACRWCSGHRGVDLAGTPAQPVYAALAGRISFAGVIAGRGVVVVDHGGTRTTYEPVVASVATGDKVAAKEMIGRLALLGSHCLPRACLHWGLIRNRDETYLDPLSLLEPPLIRLLPLWSDEPTQIAPWRQVLLVALAPVAGPLVAQSRIQARG